ncbi:Predicted arabinose efflux permease, MFS family [Sphingomonas guangdongensis]|uniref:Predicted arabinose efflux permease, MFS family n=1 Tax=Sphingomonas guangdongensis TaxID=1141890 RepID=A0A285R0V5_9SPHN|nr:MFS transporter [Sphingomonas guangdongensis]SOB87735.1 Predicted arabinose efflux permease, MFS family [Sphingomonas guangdongensis]
MSVLRHRRVLLASFVGTAIEFYDFYIYATAASLVFGAIFFPASDPGLQQMAAFATLAVAFFARPVGAAFFGHFGDRIGRKSTLVASLLTMGVSTTLVAFLPTYQNAGWIAPAALCVLRFGQGFGLGGEWGGAALLAVENAPPGWRARFGAAPQMGAPAGFIAANGLFLLLGLWLTPEQFAGWGWRIPFLISALLVAVGLWIRLKLTETPEFAQSLKEAPPPAVPLAELVRQHGGMLVGGTVGAIACFATYYVGTAFLLGYGTKSLGFTMQQFLSLQLGAILFMGVGIYLAAWAADRHFDERRVLAGGCVATILLGFTIAPLMQAGLGGAFVFLSATLLAMGFVYGPLGAWLPGLFPPRVRYTGASMTFNIAGVLGGGLTPLIAQALALRGGLAPVGLYLSGITAVSLVALLALRPRPVAPVPMEGP